MDLYARETGMNPMEGEVGREVLCTSLPHIDLPKQNASSQDLHLGLWADS